MEDLSLHILDVVENSTSADATVVEIKIVEDVERDLLQIVIKDNGRGMDEDMVEKVKDPFMTTRTTRKVGMGISLLEQSAVEAEGNLVINSEKGKGTEIIATFKNSHIDRKPIGDIASTIIALILGNPEIDFIYVSNLNGVNTELDTREIKAGLNGINITNPDVLELIRGLFEDSE